MMHRSAEFSPCQTYRYKLGRTWNPAKPPLLFVMLNPSVADANIDDRTINKCMHYSMALGFGGLRVGNLFALRSTDPKVVWKAADPVGPGNDLALEELIGEAGMVIAAWGADGARLGRADAVLPLLAGKGHALRLTKSGHPWHPLYLPYGLQPFPYP